MDAIERQKDWFEKLAKVLDTPIYVAKNKLDNGKYRPGAQKFVGRLPLPYDHRTIGSNEVVIELDAQSYAQNFKYAYMITNYCKAQEIPYYAFWSGNKSIHLHYFLDIDVQSQEGKELILKALEKGYNLYKEIRLRFAKQVVEESGLSASIIGQGKIVDLAKLTWDDLNGKFVLIRCCGGANKKIDKVDNSIITGGYKTYLPDPLPKIKPADNNYEDVVYPDSIIKYKLEEAEIVELAQNFLNSYKETKKQKDFNYEGKYISTNCVQKMIEGCDSGKRSFGANITSLAARLDGLTKDEAHKIIETYVKNCPQVPDPFDISEAEHWLDWVYKQPKVFWNCAHAQKLGVCSRADCSYHIERYKEEFAVLNVSDPLKVIRDALDLLVVGEDRAKMQLFLLFLTKEFTPEWCILIDGPASVGKTHTMKAVASLFGEEDEDFFVYSRMTKSSLNHLDQIAEKWRHKIVIIEELQGTGDVDQLRVAISEGKLTLLLPEEIKNEDGTKGHLTKSKVVFFDNLFVTCNAEEFDKGEQLLSRAWIINMDSSEDQTQRVMDFYGKVFAGKTKVNAPNLDAIRTALKFLEKPSEIIFPFAEEINGWLPASSPRGRRDIKKLHSLIKASAYFHQKQRYWYEADNQKILVADWRDVLIAFDIAGEAINASTQGLGAKDLEDWQEIENKLRIAQKETFTIGDMCRWLKSPRSTVAKKASAYQTVGLIENLHMPPMPAEYRVLGQVKQMQQGFYTQRCNDEIKKQDDRIKAWLKEKEAGK